MALLEPQAFARLDLPPTVDKSGYFYFSTSTVHILDSTASQSGSLIFRLFRRIARDALQRVRINALISQLCCASRINRIPIVALIDRSVAHKVLL